MLGMGGAMHQLMCAKVVGINFTSTIALFGINAKGLFCSCFEGRMMYMMDIPTSKTKMRSGMSIHFILDFFISSSTL